MKGIISVIVFPGCESPKEQQKFDYHGSDGSCKYMALSF